MRLIKKRFIELTHQGSTSIKGAAAIQLSTRYASILVGLGSQLVLARLLTPHDYGIMAVMLVFTAFFGMLSDFGISGAIVQNQQLDDEDMRSIYAWSLRLALVLGGSFAILSYPIARFYEDDIYLTLGCLLSLSVLFNALNMVPNALLMKRKLFLLAGIRQMTVTIVSSIVTIFLAMMGAGVYALIASSILSAVVNYAWNVKGSGLRFSWQVKRESIDKIKNFSLNVFGFRFVIYFSRNLDNLIVGKAFGMVPLGNYNRAYQLMIFPLSMFTGIIMSVLHPFLAEYQNNLRYIYEKYLHTVKLLSLLGVFVTSVCFFCADEMVRILFGPQWEKAIPCFRFMSIAIWPQMVTATSGALFQAINRTELMFRRGILATITMFICLVMGVMLGSIETVSQLVALNYYLQFFTMLLFLVHWGFHESIKDFVGILLPDILVSLGLVSVLFFLNQVEFSNQFLALGIKIFVALAVYCFMLVVLRQCSVFAFLVPRRYRVRFENVFGSWKS